MKGSWSSSTDEWLANTIAESRSMGIDEDQGLGGPSRGRGRGGAESDFWMPQVASNGQIFYINTKTGEQSRDLPQEAEDDIDLSMTDDAPLALAQSSSSSRAGPGVLGYATSSGPYTDLDPSSGPYASGSSNSQFQSQPGFGLPRRTDTPEPWIRRLADDGLSYYYLNQVDGRVQWTRPESSTSRGSELPETPTTAVPLPLHGRARSDSVNNLTGGGHGVYSDSSDVDVSLADEVDDAKGKGKQRSRGHAHSGSITTIGTTGTTETAIASGSGHSHLTTSSGGTFTGTLANSNVHNLPLSSTHSHNFSQGPDPSHKQLTPDSSFLQRQPTLSSESSDSQQALLLAAQLQSALYPPPPEDPLDMVHRARDAVERVTVRLNLGGLGILGETSPNQETSTGSMGGGREENASAMADLDTLIEDVVASVRGLLYVCGAGPSTTGGSVGGSRENGVIAAGGGGLEALIPKIMVGITPTVAFTSISASAASPSESSPLRIHTRTDSRSQSNPLKPSQRKLTATLSRLVLSARAIRYDSANASPESTIERIRGDAMELGRAIGAFGVEVQKVLDKLDRLNEDELY
ncbi:hypothetical protein C8J55DRAFT_286746 [Lentinula edodes]|uniref:WW domain-containing protein n=1 Tax=Lentinula lateritia TaxID=40482 RepID=A0A9W9DDP3_9AGAR|nr:hypothetical protein C8J55DRAFT_286746 [Lentinula edodes]